MPSARSQLVVVGVLLCGGCLDSHQPRVDGDLRDGGARDARVMGDSGPFRDSEPQDGSAGDAGIELMPCEVNPDCYCWSDYPETGWGHCITPTGREIELCEIGLPCPSAGWLCNDLGSGVSPFLGDSSYGVCVSLGACAWLRARDSGARCFYEDGTFYDTGELASDPCDAEDRGRVCGPGCGECERTRICVGVSERSGLGLCGRRSDTTCTRGSCDDGLGCVGFVVHEGVSTVDPEFVWRSCVPRDECARLASRYPTRFRCLD